MNIAITVRSFVRFIDSHCYLKKRILMLYDELNEYEAFRAAPLIPP